MYQLEIFISNLETKALKTMAKQEYTNVCSQAALVLQENLVHWKSFHLDDKGGESQEPNNRFDSKRVQSINIEIQKERKACQKKVWKGHYQK